SITQKNINWLYHEIHASSDLLMYQVLAIPENHSHGTYLHFFSFPVDQKKWKNKVLHGQPRLLYHGADDGGLPVSSGPSKHRITDSCLTSSRQRWLASAMSI